MQILNSIELMQKYTEVTSKFGMFISWSDAFRFNELARAAPYLAEYKHIIYNTPTKAVLIFDTQQEMEKCFNQTVGDDGPTKLNSYDGPARVYALTCSDKGELLTENT